MLRQDGDWHNPVRAIDLNDSEHLDPVNIDPENLARPSLIADPWAPAFEASPTIVLADGPDEAET